LTGAERGPDVTAIVVNWNTMDLLEACLRSLSAYAPPNLSMEIIVVDNGSTDRTAEHVSRTWPSVRLIANAENVGFTRANNQAIRSSHGDRLLLINADATLTPQCLQRMLAVFDENARVAAVGPRLRYGDGRWQRWTAGRHPSLGAALNYYLFLERLFPDRARFAGLFLGKDVREGRVVDWVSSACMLLRRDATEAVGLLDERLFVYMDDVDLCSRLRAAGWLVWYCPEAEAVHLMGQSTRRLTGRASPEALRSFNRYFSREHGLPAVLVLRAAESIGFAARAIAYLCAATLRGGHPNLLSQARAHWRHFLTSLERVAP
jgi:N-acetylglucosaminyl-diphospho-decaprenol L-rhamnosyltransferase